MILSEYTLREDSLTVTMRAGANVLFTHFATPDDGGPPGGAIRFMVEEDPGAPIVSYHAHIRRAGQSAPSADEYDFAGAITAPGGFVGFIYLSKHGELSLHGGDQAHRAEDELAAPAR